ncbi:MAG: MBL fold metallo-hydrolase [Gammaproteobacteria bacterium]|nr:MBL fold metallo-hydrolase [Gammaproteobacteria bacterium]
MVRRLLMALVVFIAFGMGAVWLFRAELATWAFERGALRAMSSDVIAELPHGLHLFVCGAGAPLPDPVRSGPCLAVIAGDRLFVVDAGTGGARNLQAAGVSPGRIEALFLTHFHSDHIDGLGEMAMLRWTGGGHASPLPVHGPPGVERVVDGFNRAYGQDFYYRVAHHGRDVVPPSGAGGKAETFPMPPRGEPKVVFEVDDVKVTAFRVNHHPVEPAVGYRFDFGGRSLVISGDTTWDEDVLAMSKDVDLLAHEALAPHLVGALERAARATGQDRLAKLLFDIPDYHTTPVEAAELAAAAGARALLLYHIVPQLPLPGLEAAFLKGVSSAYSGSVTLSRDGTLVSLPMGTERIEVGTLP